MISINIYLRQKDEGMWGKREPRLKWVLVYLKRGGARLCNSSEQVAKGERSPETFTAQTTKGEAEGHPGEGGREGA